MSKIYFYLLGLYHWIRMYIAKYSPLLAKIPFVYCIWQKFFKIPKLKKFLQYIDETPENNVLKNFEKMEHSCIETLLKQSNTKEIYLLFPFPSIWEYALSFILLRKFLCNYKWNIYIICSENTIDIAKIFWMYFDVKQYLTVPVWVNYSGLKTIEKYIKCFYQINLWHCINMWYFLSQIWFFHDISYKTWKDFSYLYWFEHFEELYSQKNKIIKKITKSENYPYSSVDKNKINNLLHYSNNSKLIICNFESKSLRSCIDDKIAFSDYIGKISEIARKQNVKFVINSVYNNEKTYNDDHILITRLNFQEIIRLAEYNKIQLFISERNWLNDIFKVFYPEIHQIIIYPDYYWWNVSKNLFWKKLDESYHLINIYSFKSDNVFELIRDKFTSTIEHKIQILWI